jgi:hypothetical protein
MPAIALARMDTQRATWTGHTPVRWNATHSMPPVRQNMTRAPVARHGTSAGTRAQRRCAASFRKLTEPNLATERLELAAENSTLATQCGTSMNAISTSDALLQDGSG